MNILEMTLSDAVPCWPELGDVDVKESREKILMVLGELSWFHEHGDSTLQ